MCDINIMHYVFGFGLAVIFLGCVGLALVTMLKIARE